MYRSDRRWRIGQGNGQRCIGQNFCLPVGKQYNGQNYFSCQLLLQVDLYTGRFALINFDLAMLRLATPLLFRFAATTTFALFLVAGQLEILKELTTKMIGHCHTANISSKQHHQ